MIEKYICPARTKKCMENHGLFEIGYGCYHSEPHSKIGICEELETRQCQVKCVIIKKEDGKLGKLKEWIKTIFPIETEALDLDGDKIKAVDINLVLRKINELEKEAEK